MKKFQSLSILGLAGVLFFQMAGNAQAVSKRELESRINDLEARLDKSVQNANVEKAKLSEKIKTLEQDQSGQEGQKELLGKLNTEIQGLKSKIQTLESRVFEMEGQVKLLAEASSLESQIQSLSDINTKTP